MLFRVYLSGPIGNGNLATPAEQRSNVTLAVTHFVELIRRGFAPFCPHLTYHVEQDYGHKVAYQDWLAVDLEWVAVADAIYRLPGKSVGADIEVRHAKKLNIPVVTDIEELELLRQKIFGRKE